MRTAQAIAPLLVAACTFGPDLSRYPPCGASDECPSGWLCLREERRCVPECGEQATCEPFDGGQGGGAGGGSGGGAGGGSGGGAGGGGGTAPALWLSDAGPPPGVESKSYQHTFAADGGTPPLTFRLARQTLPAELNLTGDGTLFGTPASAGDFDFQVTVEDGSSPRQVASAPYRLTVRRLLRIGTQSALPTGVVNQAYGVELYSTGGTGSYAYALDGGALPPGLMLAGNALSGTPTQSGSFGFGLAVVDPGPPQQVSTRAYTVQINALPPTTMAIATQSLADGRVGTFYVQKLKVLGGTAGYTWTVVSGAPPGLSIPTGQDELRGTPTDAGTYNVTLRVRDSGAVQMQDEKTLTLRVY